MWKNVFKKKDIFAHPCGTGAVLRGYDIFFSCISLHSKELHNGL